MILYSNDFRSNNIGLPQQYYNDLAWGGLAGTVPYNLLSESDKRRIEKNCEAEAFNMPTEEYTPSGTYVATHIPKGTPCSNKM